MAGIAHVITPDSASGAQVIDGSLKFDDNKKNYLTRTPSSVGNKKTFTFSTWTKGLGNATFFCNGEASTGNNGFYIMITADSFYVGTWTTSWQWYLDTTRLFRDDGWYHLVVSVDTTQSTESDRVKLYVNGVQETSFATANYPSQDYDTLINNTAAHAIGRQGELDSHYLDKKLSQFYWIDGQQLGPENFGFTDPLTNTWKPKKYTGTFTGTNTFYLPFDGNSPIGQDKSGNGNDWTPKNFGGSNSLEKATGARPILNTTQGASQAGVGVFGSRQNVGYAVTVYDDGGGNKYYIDGVKQATLNGLIRGATYTFDTSDSTLGSTHPFRLSATSAHGTEYTNGVAAITGAATTITIPYNAPESLYYYCTSHSGMGSSITGITTNEKLADQYASNVTLALPLVGNDDDVCASIACTANNKTPTNSSVTAATTQSNFYSGSHYWNANTDSLLYAQQGNELVFGTNDFTIEFWFYDDNGHNGNNNRCVLFDNRRGGNVQGDPPQLVGYVDSHNEINLYYANGSEINITVPSTVGKWWHYAAVRSSGTTKLYIDGVEVGSASDTTNYPNNGIALGSGTDSGYSWSGYIQDFRVYTGVAKYTSNFIPASTNPDILPDTPSGVSGSSKLTKITDGAVSFDGTGDDLHIADSADFEFGTGDFTIECFAYHTVDSDDHLISKYGSSNATRSWRLVSDGNQKIIFYWYYSTDSSLNITSAAGKFSLNRWHHIVAQRTSGDIYLFVDGELIGSNTSSGAAAEFNDNSTAVAIAGDLNGSSQDFPGFISNVRIVKGTGVYSTLGFTPPTAPLTNVTNTKLLCCQSNTSATEGAVKPGTITANGDAAATNFNPFNTDINTVRGQETGYPTLNPLDMRASTVLSNGNLTVTGAGAAWYLARSTQFITTGKYYWEYKWYGGAVTESSGYQMGLKTPTSTLTAAAEQTGSFAFQYTSIYQTAGSNNTVVVSPGSITANDCVMFAYDADAGLMWFGVNGKWNDGANPALGTNSDWTSLPTTGLAPFAGVYNTTIKIDANFGQKPFKYAPPDGFQPINAANNRPVKVISRPDQYVGVTTWRGTAATHSITGFNFNAKPDFIWLKESSNSSSHGLWNSVVGQSKYLSSDLENDEESTTTEFSSFDYNGFTLGNNTMTNQSGEDYVAWGWKAGGSKNTFNVDDVGYASASAAGLDGGSVTPSGASVGTKQGFSIITWSRSSATDSISHGLSQAPTFIIQKSRSADKRWQVGWEVEGWDRRLYLNLTDADSDSTSFGYTSNFGPTNTLIRTGGTSYVDGDMIAYCWHDVPGLQKFGKFSGNGDADGVFVELGFKPAILLLKNDNSTGDWIIWDNERNKFNPVDRQIWPYTNSGTYGAYDQVGSSYPLDFLSNGFKIRTTDADMNSSSRTYLYAAWAEAPSVDLFGGGANAR